MGVDPSTYTSLEQEMLYEGSPYANLDISGTIFEAKILKGIYSGENNSDSWGTVQLIVLFSLIILILVAYFALSILIYYFLCIPFYKYLSSKSKSVNNFIESTEITNLTRDGSIFIMMFILVFAPSLFGFEPLFGKKIVHGAVNYLTGFPNIPENIDPIKVK
jgi:hypothetical protein